MVFIQINTTKALQSLPVSSHGCLLSVWLSPLFIRTPIILKAGFTPLQSDRLLINYSCNDYFLVKLHSAELGLSTSMYFFFFLKDKDAISRFLQSIKKALAFNAVTSNSHSVASHSIGLFQRTHK